MKIAKMSKKAPKTVKYYTLITLRLHLVFQRNCLIINILYTSLLKCNSVITII